VALRIAFDLDGVLADMELDLVRQAEALFGKEPLRRLQEPATEPAAAERTAPSPAPDAAAAVSEPPSADAPPENAPAFVKLRLTARQQGRLWRHVATIDDFWESLAEIEPGSVARLASLAADRQWEIIFLTKRPECAGATAQVQTQRWLEAKGFALPSVFVVQGSRGRIAAALDLDYVIDDRPENCLDVVVDSKARAILVWRDDESLLPAATRRLGIGVVKSVGECLDILTQVESVVQQRASMVEKMKRLLGLKAGTVDA
jgi:hypothetical protein